MAFPFTVHIALTVQDLDRSVAWYSRLFDAPPVVQDRHDGYRFAAWLEPAVGLHQFEQPNGTRFDEHVSGLDHLAFNCENSRRARSLGTAPQRNRRRAWRDLRRVVRLGALVQGP
jgi:catechol 2,3-dioxygenase-like lactoylglutathione lyase family enzyme